MHSFRRWEHACEWMAPQTTCCALRVLQIMNWPLQKLVRMNLSPALIWMMTGRLTRLHMKQQKVTMRSLCLVMMLSRHRRTRCLLSWVEFRRLSSEN